MNENGGNGKKWPKIARQAKNGEFGKNWKKLAKITVNKNGRQKQEMAENENKCSNWTNMAEHSRKWPKML